MDCKSIVSFKVTIVIPLSCSLLITLSVNGVIKKTKIVTLNATFFINGCYGLLLFKLLFVLPFCVLLANAFCFWSFVLFCRMPHQGYWRLS